MEAVIKVERKPASGLKHIGRNSMPVVPIRQEEILILRAVHIARNVAEAICSNKDFSKVPSHLCWPNCSSRSVWRHSVASFHQDQDCDLYDAISHLTRRMPYYRNSIVSIGRGGLVTDD